MAEVTLERSDTVGTLVVQRATKLNSLDEATLLEIRAHVAELRRNPPRVVLVRTAGERIFAAGADVAAMARMSVGEARRFSLLGHECFDALEALPSVVVACVQGAALGGGLELVLACDLVLAGARARFGLPETNLALIPGFGGCARLLRRVGVARAREMIYTGAILDAAAAERVGIVNRVVAQEELSAAASAWVEELAVRPPLALARAKVVLAAAEAGEARTAARMESEAFASLFASADTREGLGAFLEKRQPTFRGE